MFTNDNQRLIVALDLAVVQNDRSPLEQVRDFLSSSVSQLEGLGVTVKINTIARILGAAAVELIQDEGLECFLDLKLLDIGNTIRNDIAWIKFYSPRFLTISERVRPAVFAQAVEELPETFVLPVGPLTDQGDLDFRKLGSKSRAEEVGAFFRRAWDLQVSGVICSPTDIRLAPPGFREQTKFITPAVRPDTAPHDDNTPNALPLKKAIAAGADAIIVGRSITRQRDIREATKRTLDEMLNALAQRKQK